MRLSFAWCVALGLAAAPVLAQEASGTSAGEKPRPPSEPEWGYCEYVRGVAGAESAVLVAPDAFASAGLVNAGEATGGSALGTPQPRLTAGLDYDFVNLYRGLTLRRRAEAECQRYRALAALQAAVKVGAAGIGAQRALEARAGMLTSAIAGGEKLLTPLREDVREGRATLEELNALQVRLDGLRSQLSDTQQELAKLAVQPSLGGQPLTALLKDMGTATDSVENAEAGLRGASAWSVRLRGGYDEVFGVQQELPIFGTLTVSYNLGGLWQHGANARAKEGRHLALRQDVEGVSRQATQLLAELDAARQREQARLREVSVLVTDLEGQLQGLEALKTQQVRRYQAYLVMELGRLRAEQAYLRTHVEALDTFLRGEMP